MIALFVGAFVIVNSLSITIAQRTRELATLRTLGASRRQVRVSVVVEALVMGVLASIVGLFLGLGLAKGLFALFDAVGFTLPNNGLLFETRTIIVSLAARDRRHADRELLPRAPRDAGAADRGGARGRRAAARPLPPLPDAVRRRAHGARVRAARARACSRTARRPVLILLILGTLLVFVGVALLSAPFIPALAGFLGWPATRIGGAAGTLARDNARRNPQRTASTAAALMIGLALVTLVATLAAGITQTFRGAVNDIFVGDYAITAQNNYSPIPISVGRGGREGPGRDGGRQRPHRRRARVRQAPVHDRGRRPERRTSSRSTGRRARRTTLANLGADGAFVDNGFAKDHDLTVGSPVAVTFVTGTTRTFHGQGHLRPAHRRLAVRAGDDLGRGLGRREPAARRTSTRSSRWRAARPTRTWPRSSKALAGYPNAKVQTRQQFIDNQISGLNSILNILYVLLALSVIVSLFGIVNTLVLTVFERTREIGMLRAIGMTRRQVRRMIRHESVITALIGAVVGIVLGLVLAGILIAKVDFLDFAFPTTQVIVFAIAAIIVGILAAIFPARRAAKLNPLEALHYE